MDKVGGAKSVVSGLLAFCFLLYPYGGTFPWLDFKKTMVKKDVKKSIVQGIENDNLVVLRFLKEEIETELQWENSREFEYNGQMYDVVQAWTVGDTVYYRCWWDREETKLNRRLRELAARALGKAPEIGQQSDPRSSSVKVLFCAGTNERKIMPPALFPQPAWVSADSYSSIIIQPPKPPPRRA